MRNLISALAVVVALLACGQLESRDLKDQVESRDPKDKYLPDQDNSKDFEIREFTDDIRKMLDIPNAAFAIVPRFRDKAVLFLDSKVNEEVKYPVKTLELRNQLGFTFTEFEGSCCGDLLTTTGYRRRVCVSDAVAARLGLICN